MKFSHTLITAVAAVCAGSAAQATVTTYAVTETFNQVVYDSTNPTWDTTFTGTFSYDSATMQVTGLQGSLTQAMTGDTTSRQLSYQLASVYDASLGGFVVTTFLQDSTDVFQGGGFAVGGTKEYGNQNAYATIFVNAADPTATLTSAQIETLAYADCTTGSLMGSASPKTCMTGYVDPTKANMAGGTMKGTYPVTESIAAVPEAQTWSMSSLGLLAILFMRRRAWSVR
jgi:hypothetical protein